jgi:hypothetical protein
MSSDSRQMLRKLKAVAERLKNAAVWHDSGEHVDVLKDHYVFELLVFFHAALAAKRKFDVSLAGNVKPGSPPLAIWPRKPGLKKNFSYLQICETHEGVTRLVFQLCPGIKIADRHGKARSPDVNLLLASATDDPKYDDMCACWEAKFVANAQNRLSDSDVGDFVHTFQQLANPTPPETWERAIGEAAFRISGILTNGQTSTELDAALAENGITETSTFPSNSKTRPPTPASDGDQSPAAMREKAQYAIET